MSRTTSPLRTRRAHRSAVNVLSTVAALVSAGVVAPQGVAQAATTNCIVPYLQEAMVGQGLPTYGSLTRGKTTLVKLFMSQPPTSACSTTGQTLVVTSGTLTVNTSNGGGTTTTIPAMTSPAAGSGAALPLASTLPTTPLDNAPGHPLFVVPGSALTAPATGTFTTTFSATLNYTVYNGTKLVTTGVTTVTAPSLTRTVDIAPRPLRVLVVPMGDAASSTPPLSDADTQAVTSGMQALSRMSPVSDGVNDLGDVAPAGVKFHIGAGMVNLGAHDEVINGTTTAKNYLGRGAFCGGTESFPYISQQLSQFLQAWNAENPSAPADRVLGAVSPAISLGASTGGSTACAEGYAGIGTPEAWVRTIGPASDGSRQGITGGLSTLELVHTYGGSLASSSYHSANQNADATAVGRAYNVTTRTQLPKEKNRSVLQFGLAPWDDYTTVMEPIDYQLLNCQLTRGTGCGTTATPGTVAAQGTFVLAGLTDGTAAGTDAHTYFDGSGLQDGKQAGSAYQLAQRDANGVLLPGGSYGVRVTSVISEHGDDVGDPDHTETATPLQFDVALPALQTDPPAAGPGKASTFELWKGTPGQAGSTLLYSRSLQDIAPSILTKGTRRAPGIASALTTASTGRQPAVSPSGTHVAYTSPAGIRVAPVASPVTTSAPVAGEQVAWSPDGNRLAFVRSGSLYTAPVTTTATGGTIGTPTLVYDAAGLLGAPVSRPSFSPDGTKVVVALNGDLWTITLDSPLAPLSSLTCGINAIVPSDVLPPCARLTNTPETEADPAWAAGGTIAYERAASGQPPQIWTLASGSTTPVQRIADGVSSTLPAWAGDQLLVGRPSGIVSYDLATYTASSPATSTVGDSWPAASADGTRVAFDRSTGSGANDRDVYTFALDRFSTQVVATGKNLSQLRLDLFVQCGSLVEPVVTGARPSPAPAPGDTTAKFDLSYDPAGVCPGGTLVYRLTDGYQVDRETGAAAPGSGTPHVAIYAPTPGQTVLQFQKIAVAGGATTAAGKAATTIAWTLQGPPTSAYATPKSVGTGAVLPDLQPPTGGWTPGTYTLTASYVEGGVTKVLLTRTFVVTGDRDGDGIVDTDDSQAAHSCYPVDAVTNASNAMADYDADLLPSLFDPDPCVSKFNATVKFQADSINLGSSGTSVTITFSSTAIDLSQATNTSGRIYEINGRPANIVSTAVSYSANSLSIKFPRQQLQDFYNANGFRGYVPILISESTPSGTAIGVDPNAPTYN